MRRTFIRPGFLCCFLLLFLSACASVPSDKSSSDQRIYLKDLCKKNDLRWQWDSVSQVISLDIDGVTVKGLVGSEVVLLGDHKVLLSEPISTYRSTLVVPADFEKKVIEPLLQKPATYTKITTLPPKQVPELKKVREIVIDAGHGGKDPGALGYSGIQEKNVVLDIAQRLRRILQQRGFKVKMTRDKDNFISLNERTEMASKSAADLFISIHANSSPARSAKGIEVYSLADLTNAERNEDQRQMNEGLMFRRLAMKHDDHDLQMIISDMLYIKKQSESYPLAEVILDGASRFVMAENRGIKDARFFVLRNTLIPAILIEVGFLSNPQEEQLLNSSGYRQKLAYAIAKGIIDYAEVR